MEGTPTPSSLPDDRQYRVAEILLVIAGTVFLPLAGLPVLAATLPGLPDLSACIAKAWLLTLLLLRGRSLGLLETRIPFRASGPVGAVLASALLLGSSFGITFLARGSGLPSPALPALSGPFTIPLLLLSAALEEAIYRFWIPRGFRELGLPMLPSLVTGVILFSFAHVSSGAVVVIQAAAAGIILQVLAQKTRSPGACTAAHGIHNLVIWYWAGGS